MYITLSTVFGLKILKPLIIGRTSSNKVFTKFSHTWVLILAQTLTSKETG